MTVRGYFGVGIVQGKTEENLGGLWRSAHIFGADFVFTVGRRYPKRQNTDTLNSTRHVPLFEYATLDDFLDSGLPRGARLVGVECSNVVREPLSLVGYRHPEQAVYVLGSEDNGLSPKTQRACHELVVIPSELPTSLNVASTGTVVLYDRTAKAAS